MMKRKGIYYLMYSDGLYYDSSYKVRYATSASPLGPFVEGKNSPVLRSTADGTMSGPGHHSVLHTSGDDYYIVYHRHGQPLYPPQGGPIRQVCIEKISFEDNGAISHITPSLNGELPIKGTGIRKQRRIYPTVFSSSSSNGSHYAAAKAFDNNYGTLWATDRRKEQAYIQCDLLTARTIEQVSPVFDHVMGAYKYRIDYSLDGKKWNSYATADNEGESSWPAEKKKTVRARFIKLTILKSANAYKRIGLWELQIYEK